MKKVNEIKTKFNWGVAFLYAVSLVLILAYLIHAAKELL
jgi:hypothetical protein